MRYSDQWRLLLGYGSLGHVSKDENIRDDGSSSMPSVSSRMVLPEGGNQVDLMGDVY